METKAVFKRHLRRDLIVVLISTAIAFWITKSGILSDAIFFNVGSEYLAAFIAGIFFTNIFMTPLSIAMFLALAGGDMNLLALVAIGTLGAIIGDLATFTLIRHTFRDDVEYLMKKKRRLHKLAAAFHKRTFRWLIPFAGAILLVIPIIPDEAGLAVMGVSRMKVVTLTLISLSMNGLSIALLWTIGVSSV